MATTYFGSKPVSDWKANGPAESGHNFIDQINEQKNKISGKENEYAGQQGQIDTARNAYQDAYNGMQSYSDLYNQAKGEEGVEDARAQYQKSLASVNATNSAMNNLPSSINAGSNVVLNANQRNAALGNQMAKYQNTLDYWTRQNAGDQNMYQTALASAQNTAQQNANLQRQDTQIALQDYQKQMDYANELYNQVLAERNYMRQIYGDMYDDEYQHMQQEIEMWAQNLQAETARYAQEQETARNNARIAAEKANADISRYLGSGYTWNGSEWVAPKDYSKEQARANDLDNIQKVYSAYQAELGNLRTNDIWNYINPFKGFSGDSASMKAVRANQLENKGFEDFLYNYNKDGLNGRYLQQVLREDYGDMLSRYGLS